MTFALDFAFNALVEVVFSASVVVTGIAIMCLFTVHIYHFFHSSME